MTTHRRLDDVEEQLPADLDDLVDGLAEMIARDLLTGAPALILETERSKRDRTRVIQ